MTQVKSEPAAGQKTEKKVKRQIDLRGEYLSFSNIDQQYITAFFNMHNAAHLFYEALSVDAQKYVSYCIRLSQEADKKEKLEEKSAQV